METKHTHTPGEMLREGNTLYILNEDGTNRITANIQAGFVSQSRMRTSPRIHTSKEEAEATAERMRLAWECHEGFVEAATNVRDYLRGLDAPGVAFQIYALNEVIARATLNREEG